jgi:hypothetical protein
MKHVIFPVIFAVTVPLIAADQPPAQQDSPLVAASKRTHRLGKTPAFVITNDNLVHMNDGRGFTTTTGQQNVTAPKTPIAPTPEMQAVTATQKANENRASAAAEQKKAHDTRAAKAGERQAQYDGDNFLDEDPAQAEHGMEMLAKPSDPQKSTNTSQPQSSQKPPQN